MYTSDVLQPSFGQIGVGSARYEFFSLYPLKTKAHFSKFALYMFIFLVLSCNMPCILLEHVDMGAYYPILRKTPNKFFRHR